ncbi:MAG: hypothetical protein CBB97_10410 [Candidatus Endolissoclinum sp. TMED37]|nr:MAG: hypothetical protein CBB97_10410 [Candidatus Endolissoclinum sp. TMED37]|tara:strand:+ start:428 stop:724 length:297 start_codon:yes stop_codon:yes gene_type:complete
MSRFRGIKVANLQTYRFKVRRSIDLREMADFGSIADSSDDLPTKGATHRGSLGATSGTRGYTDLSTVADQATVDKQDMGSIADTPDGVVRYNDEPYQY